MVSRHLIAVIAICALGCTAALNFDECESDSDCASGSCSSGVCDTPKGNLLTAPCQRIYGASEDEVMSGEVYLLGTLLPYTGSLSVYGPSMDKAIELAVAEINQVGGLFGQRIAALSCDTGTDPEQAIKAAQVAINYGNVPAIVGAAGSTNTIEVFNQVAKEAKVAMISPASTSTALTDLPDDGLVWRTVPSDAAQGAAIAAMLLSEKYERIAVVNVDDAYGNALQNAISGPYCEARDCLSDKAYVNHKYLPSEGYAGQNEAVADLVNNPPDVTVLVALGEDGGEFLQKASAAGVKSPFVLTDGTKKTNLLEDIDDLDLLCNLVGTNPADPSGSTYKTFAINYQGKWGEPPGVFNAHSYDALYLLAYAIAAADKTPKTITGSDIAKQLERLSKGASTEVGTKSFNSAIQTLKNNDATSIDFVGASGALDFDNSTGEALSTIEGWYYDPDTNTLKSLGAIFSENGEFQGAVRPQPEDGSKCAGKVQPQNNAK